MSQAPSAKNPPRPQVASGVPWWLWGMLLIVGGGILASVIYKLTPADPAKAFADGYSAAESGDGAKVREFRAILDDFPDYEPHRNLLDGMVALGTGRPLNAIPLLEKASENSLLKAKAMRYLGMAHVVAEERPKAITVFESILKESENEHASRLQLATILNDILALEESITHLDFLIKQEYKLSEMLSMRGEMFLTLERFGDAANDFQASIEADANDPKNSDKASKLIECLIKTGDLKRAEKFVDEVDELLIAEVLKAEAAFAAGNFEAAAKILSNVPAEKRTDAAVTQLYGRVMLAQNNKDAAEEALYNLRVLVTRRTRDPKLYKVVVDLAQFVDKPEIANLAQQNIDQLTELNKEFQTKLAEVVKTRDEKEIRVQLADLALKTERMELSYRMYDGLIRYYPEEQERFSSLQLGLMKPLTPLVSLGPLSSDSESEQATPAAPESESEPAADASTSPASETTPAAATEKPAEPAEPAPAAASPDVSAAPAANPAPDSGSAEPATPATTAPEKDAE